jgi:uncharacterized membrane protein YgdD (TMEM256/DUF423 family)
MLSPQKIAAFFAFLAIALGAFGAHALEGKLSERYQEIYQTATLYLMFTSVGVLSLLCAGSTGLFDKTVTERASALLLVGITIFSGSLYALVLSDIKKLGMITPLGGTLLLIGWTWVLLRG